MSGWKYDFKIITGKQEDVEIEVKEMLHDGWDIEQVMFRGALHSHYYSVAMIKMEEI